jgi:hypothetical protein
MYNSTFTITFGEKVENHIGNQQIGDDINSGLSYKQLEKIEKKLIKKNYKCKLINLNNLLIDEYKNNATQAGILIIKNFTQKNDELYKLLSDLNWDKKVVNKHARYDVCFADFSQEPNYAQGKGRVYDFYNYKELVEIRKFIEKLAKTKLYAEGNYYHDINSCYIGFHGDTERRFVFGLRIGSDFPLYYRWFKNTIPITEPYKIDLQSGDLYIMSDKAVGYDWKIKSILTLRHAAGNLNNYCK